MKDRRGRDFANVVGMCTNVNSFCGSRPQGKLRGTFAFESVLLFLTKNLKVDCRLYHEKESFNCQGRHLSPFIYVEKE
jgi:hypothetical protein